MTLSFLRGSVCRACSQNITVLLLVLITSSYVSAQVSKLNISNNHRETHILKEHFQIQADNPEHLDYLMKCADKFPYWYKYRLSNQRNEIEILPPYSGRIILFSANETGTRPLKNTDNQKNARSTVKLHAAQNGFKEIIQQQ